MSVQSVKKRNGCTLATAHKKIQHTLAGAEKSVKYRVWPGRNKTYFHYTIRRETQNSPAKVFTKSARLPAKQRPLRFFTPWPNTARKFSSCRLDHKGYWGISNCVINGLLVKLIKFSLFKTWACHTATTVIGKQALHGIFLVLCLQNKRELDLATQWLTNHRILLSFLQCLF